MGATQTLGKMVVNLGLVTDEKSFAAGLKGLNGIELAVKNVAGTALKAAGAIFGMAAAAGVLANSEEKSSRSIGLSVTQLEKWKVACDHAGVNSKSLIDNMARLEEKAQRWKLGLPDDGLADNLARLGSGINMLDFNAMDAESRIKAVFESALSMDDQKQAAVLVGDILGEAGEELYRKLQLSGQSLENLLAQANNLMFMNDETAKEAEDFNDELNQLKAALKQMATLFGTELADTLLPMIKELNKEIADNKDKIIEVIHAITHPGEFIAEKGAGIAPALSGTGGLVYSGDVGVKTYTQKDKAGYKEKMDEFQKIIDDPNATKREKRKAQSNYDHFKALYDEIQDGIISPGGQVTKVAPDDWVFAARDIGKLAAAFAPKNTVTPQAANFTINQSITVNGARDIPAAVKTAAYNGANKAFSEITIKSDNYLQLMPAR